VHREEPLRVQKLPRQRLVPAQREKAPRFGLALSNGLKALVKLIDELARGKPMEKILRK
jgi:hypothetical protein